MPESFDDAVLGRLKWIPTDKGWEGKLISGSTVFIFFDPGSNERKVVLAQARGWLDRVRQHEAEYRTWTAVQLLEARSNTEQEMTLAEIEALLFLREVACSSDGTVTLFWDDDDVLCDDRIFTHLDERGNCLCIGFD